MPEQILLDYIKQTLSQGFSRNEIKATLKQAGWSEQEIDEGFAAVKGGAPAQAPTDLSLELTPDSGPPENFFTRHRRLLVAAVVVIVALPLLVFGGRWAYQKLTIKPLPPPPPEEKEVAVEEEKPPAPETNQASLRDKQRLQDIDLLQTALATFFEKNQTYPRRLAELAETGELAAIPQDPQTGNPYLYTALGQPPLHYSLVFILETRVGTLGPGLLGVSSGTKLPSQTLLEQEEAVKGQAKQGKVSPDLAITDLGLVPFYPREEVNLKLTPPPGVELAQARLLLGDLDLVDSKPPLAFQFTAPATPGRYQVQVFAFDAYGETYQATTDLTVK